MDEFAAGVLAAEERERSSVGERDRCRVETTDVHVGGGGERGRCRVKEESTLFGVHRERRRRVVVETAVGEHRSLPVVELCVGA